MHELSLTKGILEIIEKEAALQDFSRVVEVTLSCGELSGVIPACLEECFPIAAEGTIAENAVLKIIEVPATFRCNDCGYEGGVQHGSMACPQCGSYSLKLRSGKEFSVENLLVE